MPDVSSSSFPMPTSYDCVAVAHRAMTADPRSDANGHDGRIRG